MRFALNPDEQYPATLNLPADKVSETTSKVSMKKQAPFTVSLDGKFGIEEQNASDGYFARVPAYS